MVKVTEYNDEYMINMTREEAMLTISSLTSQLYNDDPNRNREEFGKRHLDDATYFSIVVDQIVNEFHVMGTISLDEYPTRDMFFARKKTLKEAQDFIKKSKKNGMGEYKFWIKEVSV